MFEIKDIHASYGSIQALKGVSLTVNKGEIIALIGSNGAGKSTLLNTISGIVKADAGEISFLGTRIDHMKPHQIVQLGICQVPEGRRVFGKLTVEENLLMGAYTKRDKAYCKAKKDEVYETFPRLFERKQQQAGTLSGGEQQMLAIGRAMMSDPKFLLLDEPSLGLAPVIVDQIFTIIEKIREQGIPILLVEQNAFAALEIADRGYVLETGNITLEGNAKDLISNEHVRKAYLGE